MSVDAQALRECCGSERWRELMRPALLHSESAEALVQAADGAFDALAREDWLEAFAAHSSIGEPRAGDAEGAREQAGVDADGDGDDGDDCDDGGRRAALAAGNAEYRTRFGFQFLIRARGRGVEEILVALRERLENPPDAEFATACEQQREITALRLRDRAGMARQR